MNGRNFYFSIFWAGTILAFSQSTLATETKEKDPVIESELMAQKGDLSGAQKILEEFTAKVPADWKPLFETPEVIMGYFWDMDEFQSYVRHFEKSLKKKVRWIGTSYSKAFFRLAFISIENGNNEAAFQLLDKALALEPDHPLLLCEKAFLLARMKRYQEGYELYVKAIDARPWMSDLQKAGALRGVGIVLIDLGKLDEAETKLKESLRYEPDNQNALNELSYIEQLRKKR